MDAERNTPRDGGTTQRPPHGAAPEADALDDRLFTLDICRRALPWDAHPDHFDRLRRIEGMVRGSLEPQDVRGAGTARRSAHGGSGVGYHFCPRRHRKTGQTTGGG